MDNKTELREFLASRRAKIRPQDAGLPAGTGRRVPGLRREELAALAGVSVSWYIRLERGDAVGASDAVLNAIANTLQLDDLERRHLFHLVRGSQRSTAKTPARRPAAPAIRATLQLVLDQMTDLPAIVQNDRSDIVAMNPLARALYCGLLSGSPGPWNHARYIHLDPGAQTFYRDWDQVASHSAAMLHVAAAKNPLDTELSKLIGELATRSDDFRVRWASRNVHEHRAGVKRVHHELVGDMELVYETLALPGEPDLTLYVNAAEPGSPSADALRLLAAWSAPMQAPTPHQQKEHQD
ncbi:putative DNA-binding protein [Actinoplanes missouriensis 431]|uniref:Putative DNA-binding protein n=1 Tax=Actinoplanes missouriensis (strain ATCC 14538 / DSM 43046 / CBS 188.64 / JCM 3121 / NBRC 102363 / NCIMB 12654 / NRRL B-3342 / UNCC 431) TaxID=512565 RepID=I0H688_ACTM4|nr:helix-turn-helix transcriptional regulator [Actinoplanes missouriensis]BAL88525.1 putative DNA-binding protein [Actinoplanes missouriensis 431]